MIIRKSFSFGNTIEKIIKNEIDASIFDAVRIKW